MDLYMDDAQAVNFVDKRLKLSSEQKLALRREVTCTIDDPILVINVNPAWIDMHGQANADTILDTIAGFEMKGRHRRDELAGGHRWIFHFQSMDDMERCSDAVYQEFPAAFTYSRRAMQSLRLAADQPLPGGVSRVSLGQSAVILKMGPNKSDGLNFQFFNV